MWQDPCYTIDRKFGIAEYVICVISVSRSFDVNKPGCEVEFIHATQLIGSLALLNMLYVLFQ